MKRFSLSSLLLFPLVIFFIMQYRIGPGDTPYPLFGLIFLLLLSYSVSDLLRISQKWYDVVKTTLLASICVVVLGSAFISSQIVRHQTAAIYGVNDIVVQQEAAIRYIVHGKNPYKETYFGTPLQDWHYSDTEVNPALYHFVMEPLYVLLPIPFYWLSNHTIGYFDSREVLWLLFAGVLLLGYCIPKEKETKRTLVTLLAFSPAMLGYTLEGRSDIFVYFFLLAAFFLLQKKRLFWSGVLLAIAFLVKQSAWPVFPLYALFLWALSCKQQKTLQRQLIFCMKNLSGFLVLLLGVSLPFFLWDKNAYIASTIGYLSGSVPHSYPISGYGFSMVLSQLGFIKNVNAYYPFTYWQIAFGLPVLGILMWQLWKKLTIQNLILFYALFLFVFWYFSRYFNNSHVGYISMVLITAYLWPEEQIT